MRDKTNIKRVHIPIGLHSLHMLLMFTTRIDSLFFVAVNEQRPASGVIRRRQNTTHGGTCPTVGCIMIQTHAEVFCPTAIAIILL